MVKISSSSMAKLSIHELCVRTIITSFASSVISTTTESVKPTKKLALFVFGDSLFDPGNNQYIYRSKPGASNYYPYGQAFFNHPTGRLCDGCIIPDFIALFAKLSMLTPYLQPSGSICVLPTVEVSLLQSRVVTNSFRFSVIQLLMQPVRGLYVWKKMVVAYRRSFC
ncbi:hypothetical protein CsSME_00026698 [Camellia sinensis var. sinensis]